MSLVGKVAVVTGSGSGIGRAIAVQLAADGAAVAVWELHQDAADETVQLIEAAGGKAIACVGDAASADGVAAAVERTHAELGPITVLVNNAAMTAFTPFMDISVDLWDRMMEVNIRGPFLCSQMIIPDMLEAGWGRIVNISSSSTQTGSRGQVHYAASKGGVIGFTRCLAMEYAAHGITVNHVPPGFIDTPMLRASNVDIEKAIAVAPMRRAGQPEDIAAACSYLASEGASYVTGQTLSVNGGRFLS